MTASSKVMPMNKATLGKSVDGHAIGIDIERLIETRAVVMANSGGGKSWALRRLLEQTHGVVQQIVIDVEDEFGTLREKFDYVLAGRQGGDCPADVRCAALLARRLLELRVSTVIGIYELKTHDRIRFVRLFLESLLEAPKILWHPAMIVIDEAQIFAPESAKCESTQSVVDLMNRGRKRGFCGVLATQRSSMLSKDATASANNKLIGRFSLDIDVKRAAEDLGIYVKPQQAVLRSLAPGSFFAIGPAFCDAVTEVKIGDIATTHPRAGQRALAPPPPPDNVRKVLASLADLPAEAEEEARSVDELRRKLRDAERELAKAKSAVPAADPQAIEKARESGRQQAQREAAIAVKNVAKSYAPLVRFARDIADKLPGLIPAEMEFNPAVIEEVIPSRREVAPKPIREVPRRSTGGGNCDLPKGEKLILIAVAQYPDGADREQLSILTGYKRSTRDAYIQRLGERGFIEVGPSIRPTDAGVEALGSDYEPLPTGEDLQAYWIGRLPAGERAVLQVLIDAHPSAVSRDTISDKTEYKRSTRDAYIQRLDARKLIDASRSGEVRAAEGLF